MRRRVVSILLVPCVLLTQAGAVFGHSHGGYEPTGHDFRPHLHTNRSATGHEHSHNHHDQDGRHHEHDDADAPAEPDSQGVPVSEENHDSDAVYINGVNVALAPRSASGEKLAGSPLFADCVLHVAPRFCVQPAQQVFRCALAPPLCGFACPIYVWQGALLI
jgi:hypothetical protein